MEDSSRAVIIRATPDKKNNQAINGLPKKKINFLRIALYMLRRKSGAKQTTNVGSWKKLLGSMRPLHLQNNDQSPPPPLPSTALEIMLPPNVDVVVEHIEEAFTPPLSPAIPSSSSSVDGGMSQYASAVNLQELDRCDEKEDDEEEVYADGVGDAMIDAKAEEFIAHFYEQMRLQTMERTNRTNWSLR